MYIPFISATYSLPVFHCTVLYRRILIEGNFWLMFLPVFTHLFVYTRRSANCPRRHDRFWRRCRCPKWIRGFLDGKPSRSSAWTTDWEEAESKARDMETPAMANAWAIIVAREEMTCRMKGRPSDLDGLPIISCDDHYALRLRSWCQFCFSATQFLTLLSPYHRTLPCRDSSQISALRTEVSDTRIEQDSAPMYSCKSGLSTHVLLRTEVLAPHYRAL